MKSVEPRARIRRGDATRRMILSAAAAEFAAKGYEGASMRAIARTCGTELALIQYHFGDKLTLWSNALDDVIGEFRLRWSRTRTRLQSRPPEAVLAQFIDSLIRHAATHPTFVGIMSHARLTGSPDTELFRDQLRSDALVLMDLIGAAQARGAFVPGRPALLFYYMVGAALRVFMNASDAEAFGVDLKDPGVVEEHISSCVGLFMPGRPLAVRYQPAANADVGGEVDLGSDRNLSIDHEPGHPSTFYLLTNVDGAIRKTLDQELRDLGVTAAQMIALIRMADERRLSSARLARLLDVSAQSVTLFVKSLEKQGLIERRQGKTSRRVLEIELTPAGLAVLQKLQAVVASAERQILDGLSIEERHTLQDLLMRILRRHRPLALAEWAPLLAR